MDNRAPLLQSIYKASQATKEACLANGNYAVISDIICYQLLYLSKTIPSKQLIRLIHNDEALKTMVNHHRETKSHGFASGTTPNFISLLLKIFQITGQKAFLKTSNELSDSFLEYLKPNLSFTNGMSGTLFGFMHYHSISKVDSAIEDINIYADYIMSSLNTHPTSDASYVLLKLGKYSNNRSIINRAVQHFDNCPPPVNNGYPFWFNPLFSNCICSLAIWKHLNQKKYLQSFDKSFRAIRSQQTTETDQINLMYLRRLKSMSLGEKMTWDRYGELISTERDTRVWQAYPWHFGLLALGLQQSTMFARIDPINPIINGRLLASQKKIPLFANVLSPTPKSGYKPEIIQPIVQ